MQPCEALSTPLKQIYTLIQTFRALPNINPHETLQSPYLEDHGTWKLGLLIDKVATYNSN